MKAITGVATLIWAAIFSACATSAPDTILFNGKIFTAEPAQLWAEALAIRGERIVAIGDDEAITPVWLAGFTGHGVLLNSAAMALVDLEDDVKDPDGGRYGRDAQGLLNGRLEEYAGELAERRLALTVSPALAAELYRKFAIEASGFGITTIQLIADPLPIADTAKRLVEADAPMRWRAYAVLSADVFTVPQEQMAAIRSVMTMIGGRTVHDTGAVR